MPAFKVEFARTVREYHIAIVEADTAEDVARMLYEGVVSTTVEDTDIIDQSDDTIARVQHV